MSTKTKKAGVVRIIEKTRNCFNDIMLDHEKSGGRPQPRMLMDVFKNVVNGCALIDLGFIRNVFTWERSRGTNKWIQE